MDDGIERPTTKSQMAAARALLVLAETGIAITPIVRRRSPLLAENTAMLAALMLWLSGPRRPSALALSLDMTTSGTTKLVQRLEREGLVHKMPDPTDGRAIEIHLTDAGRTAIEDLMTDLAPIMELATKDLSTLGFHDKDR